MLNPAGTKFDIFYTRCLIEAIGGIQKTDCVAPTISTRIRFHNNLNPEEIKLTILWVILYLYKRI